MGNRGRYGSFDAARTIDRKLDLDEYEGSRFEALRPAQILSEVYNSNRPERADRGMEYIREIVALQDRMYTILSNEICTKSEMVKMLGIGKKDAFMVGVAMDYMHRKRSIGVVGSKPGPGKDTVEPIYSSYFK